MVRVPTAPLCEMHQRPTVELAGTIKISNNETKAFYFDAHQDLRNFVGFRWNYDAHADQTKIPVRAAINPRYFQGGLNVPPMGSHVFVRGIFDNYFLNSETKQLSHVMIIVDSIEILYEPRTGRLEALPSTPGALSASSFEDDQDGGWEDEILDVSNLSPL
jgi:hypothetical protein